MMHAPYSDDTKHSKNAVANGASYKYLVASLITQMSRPNNVLSKPNQAQLLSLSNQYRNALIHLTPQDEIQNARANILLSATGIILECNSASRKIFSLDTGHSIADTMSTPGDLVPILERLVIQKQAVLIALHGTSEHQTSMVGVFNTETNQISLMEAEHGWPHGFAEGLVQSYGLTKRECSVLEALCSGDGSTLIAQKSNRKIGTIRQQIKSILTKLEVKSQAQAVALITTILVALVELKPRNNPLLRQVQAYTVSNSLEGFGVNRFGLSGGMPVLFFHGALFGIASIPGDCEAAETIGLDIIAPHRPGYGQTPFGRKQDDIVARAVSNAVTALDGANISRAVILAHDIGTPYAFAFAARFPERVAAIVCGPTTPPMHNWEQTEKMPARHRVNAWAAQKLPGIMDTLVALGIAHIGRRGASVIPEYIFADCDFDRLNWQSETFQHGIMECFELVRQQNGVGFQFDMHLTNNDWSHIAHQITCPTLLLHGLQSQTVSLDAVRGLTEFVKNGSVEEIKEAGHTLPLTHTPVIFRHLARLGALAGL